MNKLTHSSCIFYIYIYTYTYIVRKLSQEFPTFGAGLLDFKLNSSPRPELLSSPRTLVLARSTPRASLECPTPETPWSAQPPRLPAVPNPKKTPWSAQPSWSAQPRVSLECPALLLECPTPESPWSAQPQLQAKLRKRI